MTETRAGIVLLCDCNGVIFLRRERLVGSE